MVSMPARMAQGKLRHEKSVYLHFLRPVMLRVRHMDPGSLPTIVQSLLRSTQIYQTGPHQPAKSVSMIALVTVPFSLIRTNLATASCATTQSISVRNLSKVVVPPQRGFEVIRQLDSTSQTHTHRADGDSHPQKAQWEAAIQMIKLEVTTHCI